MSDIKQKCDHKNKTFMRTDIDWDNEEEEDIYVCNDCDEPIVIYKPG